MTSSKLFQAVFPGLVVLALAAPATAQPGVPWPDTLRHRNARYAALDRVDDEAGDVHERLVADAVLARAVDPLGDREETRRNVAASQRPPRATQFAQVDRVQDDRGDDALTVLARLSRHRRHADLRRLRDFQGDMLIEVALWRAARLRGLGAPEEIRIVEEEPDPAAVRFMDERADDVHSEQQDLESPRDLQREDDRRAERDTDRQLLDDVFDDRRGSDDLGDEPGVDDLEDLEAELDDELDAVEDALEADESRAEAQTERADETATARQEATTERETDREVEQQIQQEEERD